MRSSRFRNAVLAMAVAACCVNGIAVGATYTVVNTNDSGAGSLRDAILNANAGGGEIVFDGSVTGRITLSSALPGLAANITITGPGTNVLTLSGANAYRVLSMNPGTTNAVSGLTIADGWSTERFNPVTGYYEYTFASGISNAGSLKLVDCVVTNCSSYWSYGVGIYNTGILHLERCLVTGCYDPSGAAATLGGGLYNSGTVEITNSIISYCKGGGSGGSSGGGGVYNTGTLMMSGSVIDHCVCPGDGDGGGIRNFGGITLNFSIVSNCSAYWAGGIESFGDLRMTNCSVLNNQAQVSGGVLSFGTAVLSGCTVAGNQTGIVGGGVDNLGAMALFNCTISSNLLGAQADKSKGSGISDGIVDGLARATSFYLNHCTVVSNSGPVQVWTLNTITSDYSILSNCVGALSSMGGHNLIVATNGCTLTNNTSGNLYNVDPRLGPLQNNGGPTLTHALLLGSPAINAAGAADSTPADQRGVSRPQGPASDIGAYEFSYELPRLVRMTAQPRTNSWLQWNGLPGGACTVQGSTNCVSWINLTNLVAGANGTFEFIDTEAGNYAFRFYRLMMPVPPGSP